MSLFFNYLRLLQFVLAQKDEGILVRDNSLKSMCDNRRCGLCSICSSTLSSLSSCESLDLRLSGRHDVDDHSYLALLMSLAALMLGTSLDVVGSYGSSEIN